MTQLIEYTWLQIERTFPGPLCRLWTNYMSNIHVKSVCTDYIDPHHWLSLNYFLFRIKLLIVQTSMSTGCVKKFRFGSKKDHVCYMKLPFAKTQHTLVFFLSQKYEFQKSCFICCHVVDRHCVHYIIMIPTIFKGIKMT